MTDLTGKPTITLMNHAVREQATTKTTPHGYHHKISHASGQSIGMLTQGSHGSVVSYSYSIAGTVSQHRPQWDDTLPRQVRRILNAACHEVSAVCTDAHRTYAFKATIVLHHILNVLTQGRYKKV